LSSKLGCLSALDLVHEGARASDAPSRAHHIERRRLCARDRSLLVQLPLRNQREQPCLHFRRLGEPASCRVVVVALDFFQPGQ
jgi:hypothetical protein